MSKEKKPSIYLPSPVMREERLAFDSLNVVKKKSCNNKNNHNNALVRSLAHMLHQWNVYAVSFVRAHKLTHT